MECRCFWVGCVCVSERRAIIAHVFVSSLNDFSSDFSLLEPHLISSASRIHSQHNIGVDVNFIAWHFLEYNCTCGSLSRARFNFSSYYDVILFLRNFFYSQCIHIAQWNKKKLKIVKIAKKFVDFN